MRNERGIAMAMCLFVMAMITGITVAAMTMSRSDILTSRNYRSASQGLDAAEAGIAHAVQIISNPGVLNLKNDIINTWPGGNAPFGANPKPMQQNTKYSYSVQIFNYNRATGIAALANDANRGLLVATGTGSDNSRRQVRAFIIKSDIPNAPPGAIYLATDSTTNSTFNGNNFQVNGNDVNINGTPGPKPAVPGLTTRTEANAQEARDSLNSVQKNNITGQGFVPGSPATPAISATQQGMTSSQINQMITDLLALPHCTLNSSTFNNSTPKCAPNNDFGSQAAPQIVYLPGNGSGVTMGNGNPTGYGILIVENALTINGNLDWNGLILVRGTTSLTDISGSATIFGSIWTTDFNLTVAGHADIQYSSQALALANQAAGPGVTTLPAPVKIYAWRDVY
jgi:hypothetical protein